MPDVKISDMTPADRMLVDDLIEKSTGGTTTNSVSSQGILGADQSNLPPATQAAEDDEFDAGSLDAKWTWQNQGSAAVAFSQSLLKLSIPSGAGRNIHALTQPAPAGNWTITTKLQVQNIPSSTTAGSAGTGITSGGFFCGLTLRESGTGKLIILMIGYDTVFRSYTQYMTNETTFGGSTPAFYDQLKAQDWYWLRISYDGTNYSCSLSLDGVFFQQYYQAVKTNFFTVAANQIGIFGDNVGGVAFQAIFDYFRLV